MKRERHGERLDGFGESKNGPANGVGCIPQSQHSSSEERTLLFLAKGMLCNIAAALDMPEIMEK